MDDEQFKTEVLIRLDKIVQLLSISCNISKAALERSQQLAPKQEAPKPQPAGTDPGGTSLSTRQYLIKDEMQENYDLAVQRWKTGRGCS